MHLKNISHLSFAPFYSNVGESEIMNKTGGNGGDNVEQEQQNEGGFTTGFTREGGRLGRSIRRLFTRSRSNSGGDDCRPDISLWPSLSLESSSVCSIALSRSTSPSSRNQESDVRVANDLDWYKKESSPSRSFNDATTPTRTRRRDGSPSAVAGSFNSNVTTPTGSSRSKCKDYEAKYPQEKIIIPDHKRAELKIGNVSRRQINIMYGRSSSFSDKKSMHQSHIDKLCNIPQAASLESYVRENDAGGNNKRHSPSKLKNNNNKQQPEPMVIKTMSLLSPHDGPGERQKKLMSASEKRWTFANDSRDSKPKQSELKYCFITLIYLKFIYVYLNVSF